VDDFHSGLLKAAVAQYGEISPTATRASFNECLTEEDRCLIFWFNDPKGNTRAIVRDKPRRPYRE